MVNEGRSSKTERWPMESVVAGSTPVVPSRVKLQEEGVNKMTPKKGAMVHVTARCHDCGRHMEAHVRAVHHGQHVEPALELSLIHCEYCGHDDHYVAHELHVDEALQEVG